MDNVFTKDTLREMDFLLEERAPPPGRPILDEIELIVVARKEA